MTDRQKSRNRRQAQDGVGVANAFANPLEVINNLEATALGISIDLGHRRGPRAVDVEVRGAN